MNVRKVFMKRIIALALAAFTLLSLASCEPVTTVTEGGTATADTDGEQTEASTVPDISPSETEEAVFFEPSGKEPPTADEIDISKGDWGSSVDHAAEIANGVQAGFTDGTRSQFAFSNLNAKWVYELSKTGSIRMSSVTSNSGVPYFTDTMDVYAVSGGETFYSSASLSSARMNAFRIGYYYYDVHFLEQDFASLKDAEKPDDGIELLQMNATFRGNQVSAKRKDGVLTVTVKNPEDPYVAITGLDINTDEYKAVEITMKTEAASNAQIYLVAGAHTGFNGDQMVSFNVTAGVEKTYVVPLGAISEYNGSLKGFRIDCGSKTDEVITITSIKLIKDSGSGLPLKLERTYHTFPDKLHEELRFLATEDLDGVDTLVSTVNIPEESVYSFIIGDAKGEYTTLDGVDFSTCRYVAFDIKGAGVFGVILPKAEDNGTLRVALEDGVYTVYREYTPTEGLKSGESYRIGHRLYTSEEHLFNPFREAVYEEENPLEAVYAASSTDGTRYVGYDPFVGIYKFYVNGTNFNEAYYRQPDRYFRTTGLIAGDGVKDRNIYIRVETTSSGALECAALLDGGNTLLPIGLEVSKNFRGEKEEPLYYPEDKDYGEVYFPVTVKADEGKRFTVLSLYQNWGGAPLKQLSSIQFHISYYHLSIGVTETNCIAPYFVYGKDAWTLPDFRALSSPLWTTQPQHTSAGRIYFLEYRDSEGEYHNSESQGSNILSAGPIYADVEMDYISDDGKLKAEYRHTEHPQTDETRTYYQIRITALEDLTINNFKEDFSFVAFDGRSVTYTMMGYLNANNECSTEKLDVVKKHTNYVELGSECPYFSLYKSRAGGDTVNMALLVKDSKFVIGGKESDARFVLVESYDGALNRAALTLDLGEVTLKKGDTLELDIILLPWGDSDSANDSNVVAVREDACLAPYKLDIKKGSPVDDAIVPSVKADGGEARFTVSGGKNVAAVRVYGLTNYKAPEIYEIIDGKEAELDYSPFGFDGYQVYKDDDGTYSFAFRVDLGEGGVSREFVIKQGK